MYLFRGNQEGTLAGKFHLVQVFTTLLADLASPSKGCRKVLHKYRIIRQAFCEREKRHLPILQISKTKQNKTHRQMPRSEVPEVELVARSLTCQLLALAGRNISASFCHQLNKTDSETEQLPGECSLDKLQLAHKMEIETEREHTAHFAHKRCNTFS